LKKQKLLLVDDDELILLTFEEYLNKAGYDVDTVESGEKAIEQLEKGSSYDLVITDLRMYGESGVDVFKKAQKVNANTSVLIMSGFGSESPLFKEAMELKPCGHAIKPFSEEELLEKVRTCLEGAS